MVYYKFDIAQEKFPFHNLVFCYIYIPLSKFNKVDCKKKMYCAKLGEEWKTASETITMLSCHVSANIITTYNLAFEELCRHCWNLGCLIPPFLSKIILASISSGQL